ncbi:MAG TPA: ClbS/DfsB family four-helix bundle protein [Ktedonobacteraceae bacterium]|jgi:hypothetical protein|nr:ClbS/DfsB family four-helix bundle protein [Ktedonobacteraceae bacterium]
MAEHFAKAVLLQQMHDDYTQLELLLEPLTPEQVTIPGVNGSWSIKDNLAHLTAWMDYAIQTVQAVHDHTSFTDPYANQEDDESNETLYQAWKDRPYTEIRQQFQTNFQSFVRGVESLSEEQINAVPPWASRPLALTIIGNSTEHFQEHRELIEKWLAQQTAK